jgi:hypothetical protein
LVYIIIYSFFYIAKSVIDRNAIKTKFALLLQGYALAVAVEKSIFEFSLKHIISHNLLYTYIKYVYNDKVQDIYENLNEESSIKHDFLLANLLTKTIKPEIIAFLTCEQLFPKKWQIIINKN